MEKNRTRKVIKYKLRVRVHFYSMLFIKKYTCFWTYEVRQMRFFKNLLGFADAATQGMTNTEKEE